MTTSTSTTTALLNGVLVPLDEARVSPMDRGFLFGDGIYEVIPSYGGQLVGFSRHMQRLAHGLAAIGIPNPHNEETWQRFFDDLLSRNGAGNLAIYLQVTRGVAEKRAHRFPETVSPTVFAYTYEIEPAASGDKDTAHCLSVATGLDLRWKRCHIKSVALLGNVLHMMEGVDSGADEILLFNDCDELTEAAACNVFVVSNGTIVTPELDHQKLPGITRNMLIDMIRKETDWPLEERPVTRGELLAAEEVWLTSSTKEVAPVTCIDNKPVASGQPGPIWSEAQRLFSRFRFEY